MMKSFVTEEREVLADIARTARGLCMDTVLKSKSGHIGLPLGAADILTLLYFGTMNHDPQRPLWPDRDRFVLSAGHGSALLYVMLHLAGYKVTIDDLKAFRQLGSKTPGHPEFGCTPGVECTTGPLGQGIAMAVGMALAEAHLSARFALSQGPSAASLHSRADTSMFDHRTFALVGDGCLMEGVALESISLAGHLKLNRLIALYDDNSITIDGQTNITFTEDVASRFASCGWQILRADGHDFDSLAACLDTAIEAAEGPRGACGPTLMICRTVAGKGLARWEGRPKVHGNPHTADDVKAAKISLGLPRPEESFYVSSSIVEQCSRLVASRAQTATRWYSQLEAQKIRLPADRSADFCRRFPLAPNNEPTARLTSPSLEFTFEKDQLKGAGGEAATRVFSGRALQAAFGSLPELIGGSADLAGSNNTTLEASSFVTPGDYSGNNIHFGVREHAMAALANGMALHGGMRPYCATFAVFSDYMRPAIRLAALMRLPTVFVLTHDSYAVGEDGPTHQPVEHAAALRVIPGLRVLRPADGLETFAAWQSALANPDKPVALLLTRQNVPDCDDVLAEQGLGPRSYADVVQAMTTGGMMLRRSQEQESGLKMRDVTLLASGSEVADALRVAALLEDGANVTKAKGGESSGLRVHVVSCPDPAALAQNPAALRVLAPEEHMLVAIEAGVTASFASVVGRDGLVIGIDHFGESAPAACLKSHFGLTPDALAGRIVQWLEAQN